MIEASEGLTVARILVLEEEEEMFEVLCATLERAGHAVVRAEKAKQGRDTAPGAGFDLVVTDTPLPDWCGPEFLRELRRGSPRLKVIVFTGGGRSSPVGYLPTLARFGAVCALGKPFARQELLDAVRLSLSADPAGGDEAVVAAGDQRN